MCMKCRGQHIPAEKMNSEHVLVCTISIPQCIGLGSPQLLFINKYQPNIFHINQSCIYFRFSLSYYKIIISYTLNF